jgi:hypothetical protein
MARNKFLLAALLVMWFFYYALFVNDGLFGAASVNSLTKSGSVWRIGNLVWLASFVPFMYILVRFNRVLEMRDGYPAMTQMITIILMLDLLGTGTSNLLGEPLSSRKPAGQISIIFVGVIYFVGMWFVWYAHRWSRAKNESLTICFNTAAFAYLLVLGIGYICYTFLSYYVAHAHVFPGAWWVGPVHLFPTIIMFTFRQRVHAALGRRWIQRRLQGTGNHTLSDEIDRNRGSLSEVSIARKYNLDLNSYLEPPTQRGDRLSLLIYAAANGHADAVEMLVATDGDGVMPAVSVNKGSEQNGWTPLYMAAKNGHVDCLRLLVDAGANVNQVVGEQGSETALYAAVLHCRPECVQVLIDAGSYGADLNQEMLLLAEAKGYHAIAQLLIEQCRTEKADRWMGLESRATASARELSIATCASIPSCEDSSPSSSVDRSTNIGAQDEVLSASLLYN